MNEEGFNKIPVKIKVKAIPHYISHILKSNGTCLKYNSYLFSFIPNCPESFEPQTYIIPSSVNKAECLAPQEACIKLG